MTHGIVQIYDTGKQYLIYYVQVNGETTWYTDREQYLERITHA